MTLKGYRFSVVDAAIKKPGDPDVALVLSDEPAIAAAVFTTNAVKAAPVLLSMERIQSGYCQALIVNSGNANACTGATGLSDARLISDTLAALLEIPSTMIQVCSTGVIGVPLPMERFTTALPGLVAEVGSGSVEQLAAAIMTTDTFPKCVVKSGVAGGVPYTIAGVAKGAGMIMPNMATMLSFILTDAAVAANAADSLFKSSVNRSFNAITIDGDTSTNDTCLFMANGAAANPIIEAGSDDAVVFAELLDQVLMELACLIVKDGEGATKFVTITVTGAADDSDAKKAALAIANSSLVKTAFYGQDANWGRIFAAVGYSGARVDQDRLSLRFDQVLMAKDGVFAGGDAEQRGTEVLKQPAFTVTVDLGVGSGHATVFTSDLSHDYVSINADYRT